MPSRAPIKTAALAFSLLLSSANLSFAQGESTSTNPTPVTTTTSSTSTTSTTQSTSTTPATTSTTPPASSGTDFLKDYETSTPTKTTVPPASAHPTPPAAHNEAARESLKQAPKAPPAAAAAKPIFLKGRLEEVSGNGASLPVGLLLGLKAQKGKIDTSALARPKADPLKGMVASFPTAWQGAWGGNLSVWWTQIDPAYWQWDHENAEATAEICKRGATGTTTVNFYQSGNTIQVQPPRITFPPRQSKTTPVAGGNPFAEMMQMALTSKIPIVVLGDYQGQGVGSNTLNSVMVKNDIKQLKPGVLEENVIVREAERKASGEVKNTYSETVIRFTKTNDSQLYVQAASIKYRNDGHFLDKVIFYGTINRGQVTADPMTNPFGGGMPNIPGMPTSPGGAGQMPGMGDLNNLIKQLQNGLQ